MDGKQHRKFMEEWLMLIWIRVLLTTAAEIKTLEAREMLVGLISPPVTD